MTEDERQDLLRTVAESHASLSEVALKLRRHRPPKAPALKTAIQAERGANSNIRAARAGPSVSYRVTDPSHRAGHRGKTVLLRAIEKGLIRV